MTYLGHIRALMILGLPLIGGHLGQMAIGITDTVMVGRYGSQELAAIGLGSTFFYILFLAGSGFAWAVMPLVARFAAAGDEQGIRRSTRMGMWLSMVFAVLCLPVMLMSEPLLLALKQDPRVAADASMYLRIAAWGVFPALAVMVIKSYLAALEHTQAVLWVILVAALFNGVFNWVFIFGNLGAPELGLQGAALASVFTQVCMLIGTVIYAVRVLPEHDLFRRIWRIDGPMLKRVFSLGWPIGLTTLSEAGLFTASTLMMGWLGVIELATHTIVLQLAAITFMVHMGLSNAATIRAGNALGRGDIGHLINGAKMAIALSVAFGCMTIVMFLAIPEPLVRIFLDSDDPALGDIMRLGITLLAVAALFQLVDGAQVIALGVLRGVQDTQIPMVIAAFSYWGIGLPSSYLFGFYLGWGGSGVWMGLVTGLASAAVLLLWRFWGPVLRILRASHAQETP